MSKHKAFGTTLTWNNAVVAGLKMINGIELGVNNTDVTTHQSPDNFEESLPVILTAGEVTLEGFFDNTDTAGQLAMLADTYAMAIRTGIITFPAATGSAWTFTAYISGLKVGDADVSGAIPFTAKIKITGKPVFAVATVTGMSAIEFDNDVLIMPAFAIGRYGTGSPYVVTITAGQTATVVTPVDATSGEVITITTDGASAQVVATGEASSACTLDVDDVTVIVVTISKANFAPKVYTFHCAVLAA